MPAPPCQSFKNLLWFVAVLTIGNWLFVQGSAQVIPCEIQCLNTNVSSSRQDYLEDCTIAPKAPFVSYIGSHNVTLRWNPANISGITYMVQSKYVNFPSEWENTKTVTELSYTVSDLQPYTEYFFRVIWIICQLQFYSKPSPAYKTLAYGAPASAPVIESLHSFSSNTIEVSWLPPLFPNGPIVGYNLKLSVDGEIPIHFLLIEKQLFQFYGTKATTTYRLSITAVNKDGEGPAAEANITTLGSAVPDKSQWFFMSRNDTLKWWENLEYDVHEAQCLTTRSKIHSVSVNVHTQAVYFSEANYVWWKGATNMTDTSDLKIFHIGHGTITSLCVDWLYDKMYFIRYNQIYTCNLMNCTSTANIPVQDVQKPRKITADPYNGYLFLLLDDGIHRMNLPEPSINTNITEHIIKHNDIQDFILTVQSKRIVYARRVDADMFYLMSVFLDGSDEKLLRQIHDGSIKGIKSFLYFNDSLMFTDGDNVWYEEFLFNSYWYNEYLVTCNTAAPPSSGYDNMILYGESTQPVPVPGIPEHVSVVFGSKSVEILWKPPKLTIGASPTAWQKWIYRVYILSEHTLCEMISNITLTEITVTGLNLSTRYQVAVQASSPAGESKWTEPVEGTTLCPADEDPYFLAVGFTGIWRQPLDMFGPGQLISDKLRYVSDLDWYNGTIYWSNETGHVHLWKIENTTDFSPLYVSEIRRAGPLTFDWIGQCIYWADKLNPKIYRTSLRTHDSETVKVISSLVKDLAVDSVSAFLYWTTGYTVESSRLNGQDHVVIQNLTLSSTLQVVALTLNLKEGQIYWLAKNGLHINMYQANTRSEGMFDMKVTQHASWGYSEITQHALMFHCNRLFWINGQKYITVQEINQSSCTPLSQPAEFTSFTLGLNALKPFPGNFSYAPEVIPGIILSSSFKIRGNYSDFIIQWTGPSNTEYGSLFYCVESTVLQELLRARYNDCLTPETFTDSFYAVKGLEPYTEFDFAVTPHTYWARGPTTSLTLHAPEEVPSPPLNPRVYSLQNASIFNRTDTGAELRWDAPRMSNGILINFAVSYRVINESTVGLWITVNTTALSKSFMLYGLSPGLLLQFQVQAYTSAGPGPFSEVAEAFFSGYFEFSAKSKTKKSQIVPPQEYQKFENQKMCQTADGIHMPKKLTSVDSYIHPAPVLITTSINGISFHDVDRKQTLWNLKVENLRMISYIAHDEQVFYLDNDTLILSDLKCQSTVLLLKDALLSGCQGMTVDWIARHIYLLVHSEQNGTQLLFIDLEQKEKVLNHLNSSEISPKLTFHSIVSYPLLSRIYWINSSENGNRLSFYDRINDTIVGMFRHYKKTPTTTSNCDCYEKNCALGTIISLDTTDKNNSYIFFLCNVTEIWSSDLDGCHCWNVISVPLLPGASITSLSVDDYFIYWSIENIEKTSIYHARKITKVPFLLQTSHEHIQATAYSTSLQPFPDNGCLVLASRINKPITLSATNSSITLRLPPVTSEVICPFIMSCTPTYTVIHRKRLDADHRLPNDSTDVNSTRLEFQEQIATIPELQPFSSYEFEISVRNYYSFLLDQQPVGTTVTAKTAYGVPEAATITNVTILSDSSVNITWGEPTKPNGPTDIIRYQIKANNMPPSPSYPLRKSEFQNEVLAWTLNNLQAGTYYEFKVLAFHPDEDWYSESSVVYDRTFDAPAAPHNIVPGNISLVLEWRAPEVSIKEYWFQLKEVTGHSSYQPTHHHCTTGSVYTCTLMGVMPNTINQVQAVVVFFTGAQSISDPTNFKTLAGVPSKPGIAQKVPGDDNTIQWKPALDNGSNLTYNILEYRQLTDVKDFVPWKLAYNGSCHDICVWKSRALDGTFQFRSAAANMIGLGNYSDVSEDIQLYSEDSSFDNVGIIVGSILGILLVLVLVAIFGKLNQNRNKHIQNIKDIGAIQEDKELAKLRGLSNAVGLANACYAVSTLPTKSEMENLPNFPREDLELCVFLGSGAFGEVYQGIAKNILGSGTGTQKVAVKTLKSDATDQEKVEFLKEAHLMSQFHHPNILKLLGVCLYNEPQYIILELMDGGDLLSYLRGARTNSVVQDTLLSTVHLLDMSQDISRGCEYLEKLHFVHRDLAARNCLVSVKEYNNPSRKVKIGDFGLARDVYKSDYYRKKGEGLLPVRWMAPESLIDGIFSTRSDVWSFGVLLWELFSLGQQPYQGYSNMEVLHYVCSGQRMDSPDNCPDDMWDIMLKCWEQNPTGRPTFSQIQKQLESLKGCSLRCTRPKERRLFLEGIDNACFEDTDASVVGSASEETSLTLMEARNVDGLNYLMVTTLGNENG
ncbi:proto-oncogene tyrosine-protein kinase ROS [Bufo gargarizans]|uniref:proto-oncogene tyrosine-protein kinase ROS n=1 Tax=Bufo gargarizans TaxID=30331 RepID=UPI001CF46F53|nr:proto-oncogene tyrosine-protein kinase ROS [Bufo gargarizans]